MPDFSSFVEDLKRDRDEIALKVHLGPEEIPDA